MMTAKMKTKLLIDRARGELKYFVNNMRKNTVCFSLLVLLIIVYVVTYLALLYVALYHFKSMKFCVHVCNESNSQRTVKQCKPEVIVKDVRACPSFPKKEGVRPQIYMITPTGWRYEQRADLTRLYQTLAHVPNLHWIVVEDAKHPSENLRSLLFHSCVNYTHLAVVVNKKSRINYRFRGSAQRNYGLDWLRSRFPHGSLEEQNAEGIVYFGDDDNTYDIRLFQLMRKIKNKVGIWPVGLVGMSLVESAEIIDGTVISWSVDYAKHRRFAVDMSGFAVNLTVLLQSRQAGFPPRCRIRGPTSEECFLSRIVTKNKLEPLGYEPLVPGGHREILVWHTKTQKSPYTRGGHKGFLV